ncbi:Gfo/Idh/MocA family oxidoreductase [Amylibacter sp.]|nr:Gfo/Idh/MocA family oxidoreductase [Amylibacter sp.]
MIERILIVGHGSIGKRHLRLARELLPDSDIRVLRHRDEKSIPEYADGIFRRMEDAVMFSPNLAVIANPATHHVNSALLLARAGAHLLIEKPLSQSVDRVKELLDISIENGCVIAIGYNLRFLHSLQFFRNQLSEGKIGKVLSVRCETGQYLPSWRPEIDYRQSVSARKELGGGALLELSHEFDYLRWIFGEIDWVEGVISQSSCLDIDVEDNAQMLLGFSGNGDNSAIVASVAIDFLRHDTTRVCTVIGKKGTFRWNGITNTVEYFAENAKDWEVLFSDTPERDDTYVAEWINFLACIDEGHLPMVTGEDGLRVLQIVDAIRLASESNRRVYLRRRSAISREKS